MLPSALPFINALSIEIPVVLFNGAVVYNPKMNKNFMEKFLTHFLELLELLRSLSSKKTGTLVYQKNSVYALDRNEIVLEYEKKDKVNCQLISQINLTEPIVKVVVISNDLSELHHYEKKINLLNRGHELIYSEGNYLEILPPEASKGTALQHIKRVLNEECMEFVCVGDNLNDLSMLKFASTGFIVNNCHPHLKEYNFKQTIHHTDHAIADIIYNYVL